MENATATFREGRLELSGPVDWPEGTLVSVTPLPVANESIAPPAEKRAGWLSLPPFDLGEMRPFSSADDLLEEMLGNSRF